MLLNKKGQSIGIDGKTYVIGMSIYAMEESEYDGLFGEIVEIWGGLEGTDTEPISIVCAFFIPNSLNKVEAFEKRFSEFYKTTPMTIDDIILDYVIMAPEMIRTTKRCRIYQIEPLDTQFIFRDYNTVLNYGFVSPPADLYKVVFDGQLQTEDLEDIFKIFNADHPMGYSGRSLSVSDIVELYDDDTNCFFYCDPIGFMQIPFTPGK